MKNEMNPYKYNLLKISTAVPAVLLTLVNVGYISSPFNNENRHSIVRSIVRNCKSLKKLCHHFQLNNKQRQKDAQDDWGRKVSQMNQNWEELVGKQI